MTGRVPGKVAFITGAARGQGRSHAIRLAQEGADIIAVDLCESVPSVNRFYAGATDADLAETVAAGEALDRRIVATQGDVRDSPGLKAALDDGVAQLAHVDIVCANAGIFIFGEPTHLGSEQDWQDVTDINLTGGWHTAKAVIAHPTGVNTVHPTGVATDMILNEATFRLFLPDAEHPTQEQAAEIFAATNAL